MAVRIFTDAAPEYQKIWKQLLSRFFKVYPKAKKRFKSGVVEIAIVPDREMKRINRTYRKKDKVTDVLSFYINSAGVIGQILIANKYKKNHAFLVAHALLHLAGLDHMKKKDEEVMNELTNRIIL